ncbi:hypothetical protein [Halosimplex sp. TS25]|uniref:hypothetical protein n=1 Tax=Halosimplex rarum TaxID=3396619 RepID=UPI0039EC850B
MTNIDGKTIIGGAALLGAAAAIDSARRVTNDIDEGRKQKQLSELMAKTEDEIYITTDLDCFDNERKIFDSIADAAQRGVEVTIKFDPRAEDHLHREEYSKLRNLAQSNENVHLSEAASELDRHYMVFDQKYVRMDEHDFRDFGESGSPGIILKNDPEKAEFVRNKIRHEV